MAKALVGASGYSRILMVTGYGHVFKRMVGDNPAEKPPGFCVRLSKRLSSIRIVFGEERSLNICCNAP